MPILFYVSLAAIFYVYLGYPLLLRLGLFGAPKRFLRAAIRPSISVIVAAHNEEASIEDKLRNLLALDYPRELVEILVGSDGSSDRTEEIVAAFRHDGVGLISFPKQQGKSAMQNGLVAAASGELLVFTDADCLISRDSLRLLVEHFADPRVGLVTAKASFTNRRETSVTENESLYLRYDTWLRARESDCGILAMASGSLFAMRHSLWRPLPHALGDDFVLPLVVARAGRINRLEPRAFVATPLTQSRAGSMLRMKSRIVNKDFRALLTHRAVLNPLRHGGLALGLWSHKLIRWFVPYFLLILLAASVALRHALLPRAVLILQMAFYALAAAGCGRSQQRSTAAVVLTVPMSFCLVNLAALIGTARCLRGKTSGRWTPHRNNHEPIPRSVVSRAFGEK